MTEVKCYVEGCINRDSKKDECKRVTIFIKNRDRTGKMMRPYCSDVSN